MFFAKGSIASLTGKAFYLVFAFYIRGQRKESFGFSIEPVHEILCDAMIDHTYESIFLEGVTEERRIGRRTYELAYDGDRLRLVAWRTPKAVYWISNTLLLSLDEKQMLAIARSVRAL